MTAATIDVIKTRVYYFDVFIYAYENIRWFGNPCLDWGVLQPLKQSGFYIGAVTQDSNSTIVISMAQFERCGSEIVSVKVKSKWLVQHSPVQ